MLRGPYRVVAYVPTPLSGRLMNWIQNRWGRNGEPKRIARALAKHMTKQERIVVGI